MTRTAYMPSPSSETQAHVIVVPNGDGFVLLVIDLNLVNRGVAGLVVVEGKAIRSFIGNLSGKLKSLFRRIGNEFPHAPSKVAAEINVVSVHG
jgi:hypothetical protein